MEEEGEDGSRCHLLGRTHVGGKEKKSVCVVALFRLRIRVGQRNVYCIGGG